MADTKITDLAALTAPVAADVLPIVDDTGGTPTTKKITIEDLFDADVDLDFQGPQSITTSTGDLTINPADDVIISSGDNLGMGTTSPGAIIEIQAVAGSPGDLRLTTAELTVVDGDILGRIDFQAPLESDGTDAILVAASIWAEADDTFAADNNTTELVFATGVSETAAEKMRLTSDGILGIGTSTPSGRRIHAFSNSIIAPNNTSDDIVAERSTTVGLSLLTDGVARILFGDAASALSGRIEYDHGVDDLSFWTSSGERLTIESGGDIGIGLTGPTAQLHVDQPSSSGAQPVLRLDQGDIDDSFIDYIGTSAADGSRSISSDTTEEGAKFGAFRVEINGVTKWVRVYDNES